MGCRYLLSAKDQLKRTTHKYSEKHSTTFAKCTNSTFPAKHFIHSNWFYALPDSDNVLCVAYGMRRDDKTCGCQYVACHRHHHHAKNDKNKILESLSLFTSNILRWMKNTFDSHCDFIIFFFVHEFIPYTNTPTHRISFLEEFTWMNKRYNAECCETQHLNVASSIQIMYKADEMSDVAIATSSTFATSHREWNFHYILFFFFVSFAHNVLGWCVLLHTM